MLIKNINTIVTHANCPDGKASAIILHKVFPDAKVIFLQHNSKPHLELEAKPGMLFCDFSPPRDRVQEFVDVGAYVLDHHKYSKDVVEVFGDHGVYAGEEERGVSGAVLAFREVLAKATPYPGPATYDLATLAGIRDCWVKESPRWLEAMEQAAALDFFDTDYLLANGFGEKEKALGPYLYQKTLAKAKETAENKLMFFGNMAIMSGIDTSDVADVVFVMHPNTNILAGFQFVIEDNKAKMVVSLRSRQGTDVGIIAKANGGGGHTNAAGFSRNMPLDGCSQWQCIDILTYLIGL
jgi:oligoribonuclease NrnB/cAMP/cGMP phosphodiesterase (DHH superfamily)